MIWGTALKAQSSWQTVYTLLQANCSGCHGSQSPAGGLDLSGAATDVYSRIINTNPTNAWAGNQGLKIVKPGRWDKSFLFHKIEQGIEGSLTLPPAAGAACPQGGAALLTNVEQEIVRQWIQYGAKNTGTQFSEQRVYDYYNVNGLPAFPGGAPAAPAPNEGYQIKMGPFFIEPGGEIEYYQKWALEAAQDEEIYRVETVMSGHSHHFIMYKYDTPADAASNPEGLRTNANHNGVGIFFAIQEPTDLRLPAGTAFTWTQDLTLDLNSHYINYSGTQTYGAEVYINVYTQPVGTALHEMHTDLIPNLAIYIPNNGNEYTFTQSINNPGAGQLFFWGLMGHTHKYGTAHKGYLRNANGTKGALIYDAACAGGIPGCVSPNFDYQHIPLRYFPDFFPINMVNGMIHEASYVNTGPTSVFFGPTSDDEMMVWVMMYVEDTLGLLLTEDEPIAMPASGSIRVFPNPFDQSIIIELEAAQTQMSFTLYDAIGRVVACKEDLEGASLEISGLQLPDGLYYYRLDNPNGLISSGRLMK